MDISILIALQELRNSLPHFVEMAFAALSYIGEGPGLFAFMMIVYWCVNKRIGQFSAAAFATGIFANQLIKTIACVYRPWIRDPRIVPSAYAIEGAGGYSFPSAHTSGTASSFGSFAWLTRKSHKVIAVLCVIFVLVMGFSRMYLGVHTPQDVLVGLIIGIAAIAITQLFFNWIERFDAMQPGHKMDIVVMVVVIAVSIGVMVFTIVKPYPLDYVDGVLLVDPEDMQKGVFEAIGVFMGFAIAWVLERRLVNFSTDGLDMRSRVIRFVIGIALVGVTYLASNVLFKALLAYNVAKFCAMLFVTLAAVFIAPLVFNTIEKRLQKD